MAVNWMRTGDSSKQAAKQESVMQQKKKEEGGKMFRYWLKEGEDASLTFVDGDLSPEGFLLPHRYYEHNLYLNNKWNNFFVCPHMTNPDGGDKCPICESGDQPALIALFTIIDHRVFKGSTGTVYKDTRKILPAKSQTFEMLNKIAIKRGGLAGCTFDVSRSGDKSAAVGSMFDFTAKTPIEELQAKYQQTYEKDGKKITETYFKPADYEKEIIYRTGDELRAMGLGKPVAAQANGKAVDYSAQL